MNNNKQSKIVIKETEKTDFKVVFSIKLTPELRQLIENINSAAKIILPIGLAIVACLHQYLHPNP